MTPPHPDSEEALELETITLFQQLGYTTANCPKAIQLRCTSASANKFISTSTSLTQGQDAVFTLQPLEGDSDAIALHRKARIAAQA